MASLPEAPKVVIVGGGFAAAVLALSLQKHDIKCVIYEARSKDYDAGGSIALAPNAIRVLDHVGVYDRIRKKGFNYEALHFVNSKMEEFGTVLNGSERLYHFPAFRVKRHIVRQELLRAAQAAGVDIHFGRKCIGIVNEDDASIAVEFADGETVRADLVVGADGIHSRVREYIDPDARPTYSGTTGIGGTIDRSRLHESGRNLAFPLMIYGQNGMFALMPTDFAGQQIGYFASTEQADRSREEWAKLSEDKEQLLSIFKSNYQQEAWPELVRDTINKAASSTLYSWPYYSVPKLSTYLSPSRRGVLIGDAAHAIPPTGGQGAAMAFEDAETLAYTISRAIAEHPLAELLPKWEAHRMARIQTVTQFTSTNSDMRKPLSYYQMVIQEWIIWAYLKYTGPEAGLQWLYQYNAENVLGVLKA